MKNKILLLSFFISLVFIFSACQEEKSGKGTINLSITDAPIDTTGLTGVYITVSGVEYNSGSAWEELEVEGTKTYNLLDLQRGDSEMLGSFELDAGTYTQLRFMLDAPSFGSGPQSNPGCYLEFADGTTLDLFVPSGAQAGYKATGTFDVPVNGDVNITADFDARKSVVKAGNSGKYLLKPVIRLIVDNQAGEIAGQVTNIPEDNEIVVYAYENDTYNETEASDPASEEIRFPNAITSDKVDENNEYVLAYLNAGTYDLVVISTDGGEFEQVLGIVEDVEVNSNEVTNTSIDITTL